MVQKVFALSADYGYINQITTTVKSILYHNHDSKIYVINKDIPQEWFSGINNRIRSINSQVINTKIEDNLLSDEHVSQPQINEMSYGRILIPELIANEERILYLDSDAVVNADLSELFDMDLGDHPVAAVPDLLYADNFNSGVLLFNMPVLKKNPDIVHQMLQFGLDSNLSEGDQSVLNHFFSDKYYHLPLKYNLAIGYDFLCYYYPGFDHHYFEKTNIKGSIVHFTSPWKPWKQFSTGRYHNLWWQYYDLEWSEVVQHKDLPQTIDYDEKAQFFTMTNSENIEELEHLLQALPDCTFHIAARTNMGGQLTKLITYPNVRLYVSVVQVVVDQLMANADAYLDLNYGEKDDELIQKYQATGKPIVSLDDVNSKIKGAVNYHSFPHDDPEQLVQFLQSLKK
ncbi:glycosyltransferase family 8 protein [Limosilactobacillus difficilis]|uniref:glycosyltransferase family 8 protein n=1 Tax=Limosilactobacillus difficilis TaxID=2991838 RepID=UPI0024B91620|nr:glycosyltransferase family 8 protein [Limosilactobacillus difficilis]